MKLKIALEWFLNPDHLPLIAGIQTSAYEKEGLEVELIQPVEHYDGFKVLENGEIDIHINEPLHLFEHYFDGIKSLGCFFETRGGVMIRSSSIEKLRSNQPITITTPAANPITNKIGFEILARYAKKSGFELSPSSVTFVETDFYHLKNMREGDYDGAWLCFYNFEGIEAKLSGFENLFIDQFESPYPNFSALELITTQNILDQKSEAIAKFLKITSNMAQYLSKNPLEARTIYYDYSKTQPSELMDNIIIDTLPRFEPIIKSDASRWSDLAAFLEELELVSLSQEEYDNIWTK